ncbi:MAG: hypothetical protein IPJ30_09015 [Acidobacteria bacterium]|nr:hypothetical protein [Acidobacteriota bacterium]
MAGHPHGAVSKTWVSSSGWTEGLQSLPKTGQTRTQALAWNQWTQDDTNASYILNPRVGVEVGGSGTSKSRQIQCRENSPVALYGLVWKSEILDQNDTVLKRAETDYNLSSAYVAPDHRVAGRDT